MSSYFAKGATAADKLAVARTLGPDAVCDAIELCVEADDHKALKVFKDAGRMMEWVQTKASTRAHNRRRDHLSPHAIAVVDSLCSVVKHIEVAHGNFEAAHAFYRSGKARVRQVKAGAPMQKLISEIFCEVLDQLDVIKLEAETNTGLRNSHLVARGGLADTCTAMLAVAFAFDDVELAKRISVSSPRSQIEMELVVDFMAQQGSELQFAGPSAFLAYFNGVECMTHLSSTQSVAATHPVGKSKSLQGEERECSLWRYLDPQETNESSKWMPDPSFLVAALKAARLEYAQASPEDVTWVKDHLIPKVVGGAWMHALEPILQGCPKVLEHDPQLVNAQAAWHGLADLMRLRAQKLVIAPLNAVTANSELHQVLGDWFMPSHPINHILDSLVDRDVMKLDSDATMTAVIDEMERRGMTEDLLSARTHDEKGFSLGHVLAQHGLTGSLMRLVDLGMDLNVRDRKGYLIDESAVSATTRPDTVDLLRSCRARQAARQALDEIGLDFSFLRPHASA